MKQKRTVKRLKQSGYALAAILFWVAVWHFAATAANKSLILPIPLPAQTVKTFWADCKIPAFRLAVATSLWHILSGFLIAVLSGTVCGILSGNSKFFKTLSAPLLHLIRSVPVAAFIFVAWLWVPSDVLPTVISALMVFPIIWSHIDAGLNSIDERLPEMGKVFGMSRKEIVLKIRLPLLLPHLRTACVTGIGIAWKSGVAAEVICNPGGSIGALLQHGKANIDYNEVFAVTLAIVLCSLAIEFLIKWIWREKRHE